MAMAMATVASKQATARAALVRGGTAVRGAVADAGRSDTKVGRTRGTHTHTHTHLSREHSQTGKHTHARAHTHTDTDTVP